MKADWYEFPEWYDILHEPGTAREVDGLEKIERRFVRSTGCSEPRSVARVWLEPACGTGRYLRVAARRGARVIGFDMSERMIRYARQGIAGHAWSRRARLFIGDMTRFDLGRDEGRVTLAFCPISSARHLMSDGAMLRHLACVKRALSPSGVYALGMETSRYGVDFPSEDVWEGRRGRVRVTQVVQYVPPKRAERVERVISHLSIERGGRRSSTEHLDSAYALRSYSHRQWLDLLRRARWEVLGVCDADGSDAMRGPRGSVVGAYGLWVIRPPRNARGRHNG